MESWFVDGEQNLLMLCANLPNQAHCGFVVGDWHSGRMKLVELLKRRLGYTDIIPFKLAGIAHPDSETGKKVARECLQQFASGEGTMAAEIPVHHRLSMKFLHRDSHLYPLLLRFINGADTLWDVELRDLWFALAPFKFVRMVEQSVERIHALGKMNIKRAPNHTEAYWSLGLRMSELEQQLNVNPMCINELGKCCELVATPFKLASLFRLLAKSSVREAIEENVPPQKLMEILRPMVYRCDDNSQMACLSSIAQHTTQSRKALATQLRPSTSPPTGSSPLSQLLHGYATSHFRAQCFGGHFFSCTSFPRGTSLESLSTRLRPMKHVGADSDASKLGYQYHGDDIVPDDATFFQSAFCEIADRSTDSMRDHIFFKVLSPKPSLMKGINYGSGICQGFASDEVSIVLLNAVSDSHECVWVNDLECSMEEGALRNQAVLSLPWLEHAELRNCSFQWETQAQEFKLEPLPKGLTNPSVCQSPVHDMLRAKAFPPKSSIGARLSRPYSCPLIEGDQQECLDSLCDDGLVSLASESDDCTPWLFTEKGLVKLRLCFKLSSPQSCLATSSFDLQDLDSLSTYDVLDKMLMSGWQLKACDKARQIKRAAPYVVGAEQVFYVSSPAKTVCKFYLLCLFDAESIFVDGKVDNILHGGSIRFVYIDGIAFAHYHHSPVVSYDRVCAWIASWLHIDRAHIHRTRFNTTRYVVVCHYCFGVCRNFDTMSSSDQLRACVAQECRSTTSACSSTTQLCHLRGRLFAMMVMLMKFQGHRQRDDEEEALPGQVGLSRFSSTSSLMTWTICPARLVQTAFATAAVEMMGPMMMETMMKAPTMSSHHPHQQVAKRRQKLVAVHRGRLDPAMAVGTSWSNLPQSSSGRLLVMMVERVS